MTNPFLQPVDQLGFVVPSIQEAVNEWLAKGVGPWLTLDGAMVEDYEYQGKPSRPGINVAFCQVGKVQLELIEPVDDEASSYRDFLTSGHSGLHHLGWFVEDYDAACTAAAKTAESVVQKGSWSGFHFIYYGLAKLKAAPQFDLTPKGESSAAADAVREVAAQWDGKIGELIEMNDTSRKAFALVADTAANWDGKSRPVRNLLPPVLNEIYLLQATLKRLQRWLANRRSR